MNAALILHVGAGCLGILSGTAALSVRKGAALHRGFGTAFFVSMLTASAMATYLAILIPQRGNFVGAIFTFYLVATAWLTVRRKPGSTGRSEIVALLGVLIVAALGAMFGLQAAGSPAGVIDGAPAANLFLFAGLAAFAAALDIRAMSRGGMQGKPRIRRHIWRMCTAFFIATGSFFLGQQRVMPAFVQGSPLLFVPAFAPLVLMVFWLIRLRYVGGLGQTPDRLRVLA